MTQTTPEEARAYISIFGKHTLPGCDTVHTNAGEIKLDNMSDDEALFVAREVKRMEVEGTSGTRSPIQ